MRYPFIFILINLFLVTSCTSMNTTFDCPMKPSVMMCASLDDVNAAVDRGEIPLPEKKKIVATFAGAEIPVYQKIPQRDPESVMRIWIAPYQDQQGNYHQASEVFTVVKPSEWQ